MKTDGVTQHPSCGVRSALKVVEDVVRGELHPGEGEQFPAEVFYRGSDAVECIVYNQEPVMLYEKSGGR